MMNFVSGAWFMKNMLSHSFLPLLEAVIMFVPHKSCYFVFSFSFSLFFSHARANGGAIFPLDFPAFFRQFSKSAKISKIRGRESFFWGGCVKFYGQCLHRDVDEFLFMKSQAETYGEWFLVVSSIYLNRNLVVFQQTVCLLFWPRP